MNDRSEETHSLTIKFTEQQMELVKKLAREAGKGVSECVADALKDFIRKEGSRYTR